MANEKRLIDANALKERLQGHHDFFVDGVGGFHYLTPKDKARVDEITHCIAEIVNAPTVDAVEVVRCKDCKHWGGVVYGGRCKQWSAPLSGITHFTCADDFCSYGERRNDG